MLLAGLALADMASCDRKRKREVVALANMLTIAPPVLDGNDQKTPTVLDGDGHKIMTVQSYLNATPWFYHKEIRSLEQVCYSNARVPTIILLITSSWNA